MRKKLYQLVCFLSPYIRRILYIVGLIILWCYIILNWEKCISMQFFSQFDGNNILFLVGLMLAILPFYEVEGKGFKIKEAGVKALQEELERTRHNYLENSTQSSVSKTKLDEPTRSDGSDSKQ